MTSTSFGWVLLGGQGPDADTLDHDTFDVQAGDDGTASDTAQYVAAARGAQAIATASGHHVGSVHVTWTEDVDADATALLKSLADLGFDNVHAISLSKAAQAWGIEVGRQNEHTKTGLCVLEPDAAIIMIVATGAGSVRTAVTDTRQTAEELVAWLRTVFRRDGWLPESLCLVGALADLDEVTQPIADALPIPVSDSVDSQLALARGAALTAVSQVDTGRPQVPETPTERPWRVSIAKKPTTPAAAETVVAPAAAETVVAPAVSQVDTDATVAIETPRNDRPRNERPWVVLHAKKLTISAAAVAVFGAGLSLAAGSALNVQNTSAQAADPAAAGSSVTSASVHTVRPPVSRPVPPAQPLAAQPLPPPPPPPETLAPPAEPLAAPVPEPVAVAVPQHTISTPRPTATVAVPAAPVAAPVAPPPAAPVVVPPAAAPAPAAPPPAAPLVVPPAAAPAPAPAAPPPAAPLAAPPAPIAPPPAAAPVPPEHTAAPPPPEPPPPDPIQVVLSPLFSGLP
jgi:hypothetical protein